MSRMRSGSWRASRWWRRCSAGARAASRSATRSPTGRWPTSRSTSRCRCPSSSGRWSSPRWAAPRAGTTGSPATPATRRTSRTTRAAAAGRTFPSAAGFHTAELFFTDDSGTYFFPTRDAGALVDPAAEEITPELMVERARWRGSEGSRTSASHLPAEEPYMEGHNTWCVNVPGSLLVIPVADIAQMVLADPLLLRPERLLRLRRRQRPAGSPASSGSRDLVDVEEPFPLTFVEQYALDRGDGRARDLLLRGRPHAAGDGPRRLDVRRHRPLHDARRLRRPRGSRARLPLRRGRALVDAEPDRARRACSRRSARRTTRTWPPRSRRWRSGSSAPAAPTTRRRPGAWNESAAIRGAAQRFTRASSRRASRCRRSTSSTRSASSRRRCRSSSCSTTCRRTTSTSTSTTASSSRGPTWSTHAEHMDRWH